MDEAQQVEDYAQRLADLILGLEDLLYLYNTPSHANLIPSERIIALINKATQGI